jgi:ribosomal protein S18 acetylase RimI-like enzyme
VHLLVRDADLADAGALRPIFRRASLSNEGDRDNLLAHTQLLEFDATVVERDRVRVAVVNGDVVGFATTRTVDAHTAELDDLFVDPDWMRRGVARALMADAIAALHQQGVTRVEVSANVHAVGFYESVGFARDGIVETPFGPTPHMHLELR